MTRSLGGRSRAYQRVSRHQAARRGAGIGEPEPVAQLTIAYAALPSGSPDYVLRWDDPPGTWNDPVVGLFAHPVVPGAGDPPRLTLIASGISDGPSPHRLGPPFRLEAPPEGVQRGYLVALCYRMEDGESGFGPVEIFHPAITWASSWGPSYSGTAQPSPTGIVSLYYASTFFPPADVEWDGADSRAGFVDVPPMQVGDSDSALAWAVFRLDNYFDLTFYATPTGFNEVDFNQNFPSGPIPDDDTLFFAVIGHVPFGLVNVHAPYRVL